MTTTKTKCLVLFIVLWLGTGNFLFGQGTVSLSAGLGFPEAFNLGLRLHQGQAQLGLYYGIAKNWQSVGGALNYHILGSSPHTATKPVYLKAAFFSTRIEDFIFWDKFRFKSLELRGGYTLFLSSRAGIELDAGPSLVFGAVEDDLETTGGIGFAFGIRFFLGF
jgi:hypothetical protein